MVIKSQFKDYYDYVAHQYGGGDPNIVYLRNRLVPLKSTGTHHYVENVRVDYMIKRDLRLLDKSPHKDRFDYKFLAIAAKWFLLVGVGFKNEYGIDAIRYEVLDAEKHPSQHAALTKRHWYRQSVTHEDLVGCDDSNLIGLHRKLQAPVFIVEGYSYDWKRKNTTLVIQSEIPILSSLGLPAIYAAEKLYQDLSYFVGNLMRDTPDLQPPVNVSDKDRIMQHGFDLKESFRHRVYKS